MRIVTRGRRGLGDRRGGELMVKRKKGEKNARELKDKDRTRE